MGRSRAARAKADRDGDQFLAMPYVVLRSPGFRSLGHAARALLFDISMQVTDYNNGRLLASAKVLRSLGWTSNDTITRALRELQRAGLLVETRKGGINRPSWFAVTWKSLKVTNDLDINPRLFDRSGYMRPGDTRTGADPAPIAGAAKGRIAPAIGIEAAPVAPAIGAMRGQNGTSPTPIAGAYLDMPSVAGMAGIFPPVGRS